MFKQQDSNEQQMLTGNLKVYSSIFTKQKHKLQFVSGWTTNTGLIVETQLKTNLL